MKHKCPRCGVNLRVGGYFRRITGVQAFLFGPDNRPVPAAAVQQMTDEAFCMQCDAALPTALVEELTGQAKKAAA